MVKSRLMFVLKTLTTHTHTHTSRIMSDPAGSAAKSKLDQIPILVYISLMYIIAVTITQQFSGSTDGSSA